MNRVCVSAMAMFGVCLFSGSRLSVAKADLFVSNNSLNSVLRYNETTGEFIDAFVPGDNTHPGAGGLVAPMGLGFGPDGNLYVCSQVAGGSYLGFPAVNGVLRYNGENGQFIDAFATNAQMGAPRGLAFGPDHNLYVTSHSNGLSSSSVGVFRFDGSTGSFLDVFASDTHLSSPEGLVFGPDKNLYVADGNIREYDGTTGAYLGDFVTDSPGARALTFGPNGNLFVSTSNFDIREYDGHSGAFIDVFTSGGNPISPFGLTFGRDQNLYVADQFGAGTFNVKRFDGTTGQFIDNFVVGGTVAGSPDWLVAPTYLAFSPVPEPSTLGMSFSALVGLLASRYIRLWKYRCSVPD